MKLKNKTHRLPVIAGANAPKGQNGRFQSSRELKQPFIVSLHTKVEFVNWERLHLTQQLFKFHFSCKETEAEKLSQT